MSSQSQKSQALLSLWGHLVLTSRGAVKGGKVRTILRAHDGRGPPEGET